MIKIIQATSMRFKIKRLEKGDIPEIVQFFNIYFTEGPEHSKSIEELNWLFTDPRNASSYNGFVARDDQNRVVGIIGYTINDYQYRNSVHSGVIPMSWHVSPSHKGLLGIQLLLKVMKLADFGFAIHGSEEAIQTYKVAKLKKIARAHVYTKVLRLEKFLLDSRKTSLKHWIKGFLFYGRKKSFHINSSYRLGPYQGESSAESQEFENLAIHTSKERTSWLANCPLVDSRVYTLFDEEKNIGTCLYYFDQDYRGQLHGRIVHIPYYGNNTKFYRQVISMIEAKMIEMGCCSITMLANQSQLCKALELQKFKYLKQTKGVDIFLRDTEDIFDKNAVSDWFLTYYESDKGYRDIV